MSRMRSGKTPQTHGWPAAAAGLLVALALAGALAVPRAGATAHGTRTQAATVWLCRPGLADDPCTESLTTTVVQANGSTAVAEASANASSKFDCFYVYPTVSRQLSTNADLRVQKTEIAAAISQASRFSRVCRVYSPIYAQVTLVGLAAAPGLAVGATATETAFDSVKSGFEDYLSHYNDGRPIVFIGHSQGAAMLILLLKQLVDNDPTLRDRLVAAIILGGNVEVPTGKLVGGTFAHIPACRADGETGCVIAYSSFPATPPSDSLFGRPGQGVSLQSGQTAKSGLQVLCVNPAALSGGSAVLDAYFPSLGTVATPWIAFPGLYRAQCEQGNGAGYLKVTKATGASDHRPTVTESDGPQWGYHQDDVNLALGNLVSDVAAAEATWTKAH